MVVVAVVAILGSIAYPAWQSSVRKSRRAEAIGLLAAAVLLGALLGPAEGLSEDPECPGVGQRIDLDEAVAAATASVDEHDGDIYVYECRPVRRVYRHTVSVDDLTAA